jgi:hypothetical protein
MPYLPSTHNALPPGALAQRESVRQRIMELFAAAPRDVQGSILGLFALARASLDFRRPGMATEEGAKPVSDWPSLLALLTSVSLSGEASSGLPSAKRLEKRCAQLKRLHESSLLMIEIMYELVNAGHEFPTGHDILEESAGILMRELGADLYVCRLRRPDGSWENIAADTARGQATPVFVRYMEETHPHHPVMRAVLGHDGDKAFIMSNNLRGSEAGGESLDCTPYQEGYRSRLSFILRDASHKAFGLIMLYDRREGYFRRYEAGFLDDCAKIVSLTVERRLEAGQDALAKAAGGMAHVGNNVLGIIKNNVEIVAEELDEFKKEYGLGLDDAEALEHNPAFHYLLSSLKVEQKVAYLNTALEGVQRLKRAIQRLNESVHHPVIMPYTRQGEEVLDLEPERQTELRGTVVHRTA